MKNSIYYQQFVYTHSNCFQVLVFNTNNTIKHQSFVYTQLNDLTVLFQTIQFDKLNGP